MAEELSLSPKVEPTEITNVLQLTELSILLKLELKTICSKVYGYVGTLLLMEWFTEILKTLEMNKTEQPTIIVPTIIVDKTDLSCDQFDISESFNSSGPNSAASSVNWLNSSQYISNIASIMPPDILRLQKDNIGEYSDSDINKQGLMLREDFSNLGGYLDQGIRNKMDDLDNVSERLPDDIDNNKDAQNTKMNTLDVNDSRDDAGKITKHQPMCDICSRVCRSEIGLKVHLRMHKHLPGAPVCPECGMRFKTLYCLKQHMRQHTDERPYPCTKCDKKFRTVSSKKMHMQKHTGERPHMCQQCDKHYVNRISLSEHIKSVHNNGARPYICMHCSNTFSSRSRLICHEKRCKSPRSHACEHCDKIYRNLPDLKAHMRIHTGEQRPVTASQECTYCKKMYRSSYIEMHIRCVHNEERPFKCTQCDMSFKLLPSLKSHQLVHSGERAFACTKCDKRLASAWALRRHDAKHGASSLSSKKSNASSVEKPLACVHCNERFVRSSNLTVHVKMFHSAAPQGSSSS